MKLLILVCFMLSACGKFTVGKGSYTGKVIDASWEGLIYKSCEVDLQIGITNQVEPLSSRSIEICGQLEKLIGKEVKVKYQTWVSPCCITMDTKWEITEVSEK